LTDFIEIVTTAETEEQALDLARSLIEQGLAACAQVDGPIRSIYRWQGVVQSETEWRCTLKTAMESYDAVQDTLGRLHPYEEPQIIALPILKGSPTYLKWLYENLD
jgi:periplasmic divalent cation tolerance protein